MDFEKRDNLSQKNINNKPFYKHILFYFLPILIISMSSVGDKVAGIVQVVILIIFFIVFAYNKSTTNKKIGYIIGIIFFLLGLWFLKVFYLDWDGSRFTNFERNGLIDFIIKRGGMDAVLQYAVFSLSMSIPIILSMFSKTINKTSSKLKIRNQYYVWWILYTLINSALLFFLLFVFLPDITNSIIRVGHESRGLFLFFGVAFYGPAIIIALFLLRKLYKKIYVIFLNSKIEATIKMHTLKIIIIFILYFIGLLLFAFLNKPSYKELSEYFSYENIRNIIFASIIFTSFYFLTYIFTYKKINKKLRINSTTYKSIYNSLFIGIIFCVILLFFYINFDSSIGPYCPKVANGGENLYKINCALHGGTFVCEDKHGYGGCAIKKTSDFDKICTSSDQCEGECLYYEGSWSKEGWNPRQTFKCSKYIPAIKGYNKVNIEDAKKGIKDNR